VKIRKLVKFVSISAAGLVGVLVTTLTITLLYRAYRQHEIAESIKIKTPNGIDEAMFVRLGGIDHQTYFASIHAPQKEIVLFEGGGHLVSLVMPERILAELVKRVRPLPLPSGDVQVP
jgi:hypothetical protein